MDDASRWITQTTFYDPAQPDACTGNCTEAAIASILGLTLDDVPRWAGLKSPEFWFAIDDFMATRGFDLHRMDGNYQPDGMYLASGQSVRGCSHMVVMEGGSLRHDPHPSRAGLLSVEHVWMLVPRDPAAHALATPQDGEADQPAADDKAPFAIVDFQVFDGPQDLCLAYSELRTKLAATIAEKEQVVEWVCHNGGLLNEWAAEWRPGKETCTAYIRRRLNAAIAAGGEETGS